MFQSIDWWFSLLTGKNPVAEKTCLGLKLGVENSGVEMFGNLLKFNIRQIVFFSSWINIFRNFCADQSLIWICFV
jgi:hypothetical protein